MEPVLQKPCENKKRTILNIGKDRNTPGSVLWVKTCASPGAWVFALSWGYNWKTLISQFQRRLPRAEKQRKNSTEICVSFLSKYLWGKGGASSESNKNRIRTNTNGDRFVVSRILNTV